MSIYHICWIFIGISVPCRTPGHGVRKIHSHLSIKSHDSVEKYLSYDRIRLEFEASSKHELQYFIQISWKEPKGKLINCLSAVLKFNKRNIN